LKHDPCGLVIGDALLFMSFENVLFLPSWEMVAQKKLLQNSSANRTLNWQWQQESIIDDDSCHEREKQHGSWKQQCQCGRQCRQQFLTIIDVHTFSNQPIHLLLLSTG